MAARPSIDEINAPLSVLPSLGVYLIAAEVDIEGGIQQTTRRFNLKKQLQAMIFLIIVETMQPTDTTMQNYFGRSLRLLRSFCHTRALGTMICMGGTEGT